MYFDEVTSFLLENNIEIKESLDRRASAYESSYNRKTNKKISDLKNNVEQISNDKKIYNKVVKNYSYLGNLNKKDVKEVIEIGVKPEEKSDSKIEKIAKKDVRSKIFGNYRIAGNQQKIQTGELKSGLGTIGKTKKEFNFDPNSGINDYGMKRAPNILKMAKNPNFVNDLNKKEIERTANQSFQKAFKFSKKIDLMSEDKYLIELPKGSIYSNDPSGNSNSADYLYKDGKVFHFVEAKLGKADGAMMNEISNFVKSLVNISKYSNDKITIGAPIVIKDNPIGALNIKNNMIKINGYNKYIKDLDIEDAKSFVAERRRRKGADINKLNEIEKLINEKNIKELRNVIGKLAYENLSIKEKKSILNHGAGKNKSNAISSLGGDIYKNKFIYRNTNEMISDLKDKGVKMVKSAANKKEVKYIVDSLNKSLGNNVFMTKL